MDIASKCETSTARGVYLPQFTDIASKCETSITRGVCLPQFRDIASNCETSIAEEYIYCNLRTLRPNMRQV